MASLQGVKKEEDLRLLTGYGHGENWQFRLNLTLFSSAMIFIGTREYYTWKLEPVVPAQRLFQ